ncbi:phosphatidylethanolamine-binding protein [Chaetomium tenue]|uniref:Phosphatidylethanolamine-binding protein n=1 Tax=Chaetomium tenue TaxID=1854479 RepID=A0ACB7PJF2_9PEZI|nr:phosphatidylethanolamine-binding protein [Chaetomium globosum]
MTRYSFLLVTLGWLSIGDTQGHPQQHVLSDDVVAGPKPLPQAAELVRDRLKAAEIIPTVIDDFLPSLGLHATWPSGSRAQLGNALSPHNLDSEPSIALHDMRVATPPSPQNKNKKKKRALTYAITLTDPDAPTREDPSWSEFCHWIAAGVLEPALCDPRDPGPCAPVLSHLREIVPYKAPEPPEGAGFHSREQGAVDRVCKIAGHMFATQPSQPLDERDVCVLPCLLGRVRT